MKKILQQVLLIQFLWFGASAQDVVSLTHLVTYQPAQIDSIYTANGLPGIILPTTYPVQVYKVVYTTVDADTLPTIASGAIFIPSSPACYVPLACYAHGTVIKKTDVPSTLLGDEVLIGLAMCTDGYLVCMPDYQGLGDGPGFHPYVHAFTEAHAVADIIMAGTDVCDSMGITRNEQVFLLGYSQGGHACMAAHELIQEQYANEFTVTAASPMSGPYDLGGIQAAVVSSENPYPNPGYLPYLLIGFNEIYGWYTDIYDIFVSPYDTLLPPLFDGLHSMSDVNAAMPAIPNDILEQSVLDSFNNDLNWKLHIALNENATYHWVPEAPVKMFYCEGDEDVSYLNALLAYDSMVANGAMQISKVSSGALNDHGACALPSLLNAKYFFDSLRLDRLHLEYTYVLESFLGANDGSLSVHVSGGFPPYTYLWSNGDTDSTAENLGSGNYTVTVSDVTGCPSEGLIHLGFTGMNELALQEVKVYPNPFTEQLHIDFKLEGVYGIMLTDLSGKVLLNYTATGHHFTIERNQLSSGMYYLQINEGSLLPAVNLIVVH